MVGGDGGATAAAVAPPLFVVVDAVAVVVTVVDVASVAGTARGVASAMVTSVAAVRTARLLSDDAVVATTVDVTIDTGGTGTDGVGAGVISTTSAVGHSSLSSSDVWCDDGDNRSIDWRMDDAS